MRPQLAAREQAHRRLLLLAIGALLLLSVGPVWGHHLAAGLERGLAGMDHLGPLCLVALHHLLAPVHGIFHLLVAAGLAYASLDRVLAWRRVRGTLRLLHAAAPEPRSALGRAACAAGLDPRRLRVVGGLPNPAFTAGWLRPLVYVSASLAERLGPAELVAALRHEGAHLRRRDPLRMSLLRFLACSLFWIPALRRLADDAADEAEIRADDAAAGSQPLVLAGALLALAGGPHPPPLGGTVGITERPDLLERRIRRLAGEEPRIGSRVTRRSLAGALAALALVWISGAVMAHPLPASHAAHCEHESGGPLQHLFCATGGVADGCPHRGA